MKIEKKRDKNRIKKIIKLLNKEYPNVKFALNFSNPLELLVATILSAQCTDERINKVTEKLFRKYKNIKDYTQTDLKELENDIRQTGFYKNKAKNIIASSQKIIKEFNGKVPQKMEELITLPGVGRKTANIVLTFAFGEIEGISVDTHVRRLSQRLGLSDDKDPEEIEQDLMRIVPKTHWGDFSLLLIEHGRRICSAKKPLCEKCVLKYTCPSYNRF